MAPRGLRVSRVLRSWRCRKALSWIRKGLLADNGDGTFTPVRSFTHQRYLFPASASNLSGTFNVNMELTILDEVSGALTVVSNTDTQTVPRQHRD